MYRGAGLQVVPSHLPTEQQNWKRPALKDWKELQDPRTAVYYARYVIFKEHRKQPKKIWMTERVQQLWAETAQVKELIIWCDPAFALQSGLPKVIWGLRVETIPGNELRDPVVTL
jgi:hypothetical protein